MNAPRWLLALGVLLSLTAAADAQFVPNYGPPPPGYYSGGGIRYSGVRGRTALGFSAGVYRGSFYGPGYGGYGPAPFGVTSTRITIIAVPPPILYAPPPPFFFDDPLPPPPRILEVPPPEMPRVPVEKPAPKQPEKDKDKKDKDKEKKEEPKKDVPEPAAEESRPAPDLGPADEFSRLMRFGKELFADQQYGRAAARFREASRLDAKQPLPHFLLAQALLQQGNYHGARDAILAGLERNRDWPAARFRPQELYGPDLEEYPDLLRTLERVQGRLPDDPTLLLVRGYVLWFDGRREQAAVLFRKARNGPDRASIERFLAALGDEMPL